MLSITEIQNQIIEEFSLFDDWLDRYNHLIEQSKTLPAFNEKNKKPENLISGCQSRVWLNADFIDGKVVYTADSDALITKGIVALLVRVLSGRSPKELLETDLFFIEKIGLRENLSPTRANGLLAMIKQMRLYAIAYDAKFKTA